MTEKDIAFWILCAGVPITAALLIAWAIWAIKSTEPKD
jgi:hypothetical protein